MTSQFQNLPGTVVSLNDGNLRVERPAPGSKITVLGVTTADLPLNEPTLMEDSNADRYNLNHPAINDSFGSKQSELGRGVAEVTQGVTVEFVKIAHGWGEEGFLYCGNSNFNGHIVTDTERYTALQETFDVLLNHDLDVVYIPGIYIDIKAPLDQVYDSDNATRTYDADVGDFAYQLADFCELASLENDAVISGLGRAPIRLRQFRDAYATSYFNKLSIAQISIESIDAAAKEIVVDSTLLGNSSSSSGDFQGEGIPYVGAKITVYYSTGSEDYYVASYDSSSATITVTETPVEGTDLLGAVEVFDGTETEFDTVRALMQTAFRRAFRGLNPTTTDSNSITLTEWNSFITDSLAFANNTNVDGHTALDDAATEPLYYRLWKATGGASANTDGSTGDVVDAHGYKVDLGRWISLGAMDGIAVNSWGSQVLRDIGNPDERAYISNGMGQYLSFILRLPENSSTTNKSLPGFSPSRSIRRTDADNMVAARYVITITKPGRGFVIARGITGAHNIDQYRRSDYVNLTTIRITAKVMDLTRRVADPYIGEPGNSARLAALRADLDDMFKQLMNEGNGFINRYSFTVEQTADQAVLGQVSIKAVIVPAFEVVKILVELDLSKT